MLYRLVGLEEDPRYDIEKIRLFVDKHTCSCAMYAFFELLNSKFSFQEKLSVLQYMKDHNIQITTNDVIMEKIASELKLLVKNEAYYKRLKRIYGQYIFNEVISNAYFFVISYPYMCLTVYLDSVDIDNVEKRLYFRKKAERIQKEINRHIKTVLKTKIEDLLNADKLNADSLQSFFLKLIANVMSYYYQLIAYAKELIDSNSTVFYFKIIKKFNSLKTIILNDPLCKEIEFDIQCLSIINVMISVYSSNSTTKSSELKKMLSKKMRDSIYYVEMDMQNEFEELWLQQKIDSLLVEGAKIKPNDFMDYGIMKEAYYNKKIRALLTFDKPVIRTMKKIKESESFRNSVEIIDSFKVDA